MRGDNGRERERDGECRKEWKNKQRERERERETLKYPVRLHVSVAGLFWREIISSSVSTRCFTRSTSPRIGKEPGYMVGLQSNGAVTSALVKTELRPVHRQRGRTALNHRGEHVRTTWTPAQQDENTAQNKNSENL